MSTMKTYTLKAKDIETRWHVLDAEGRPLGRLASEVAQLLRGKHRPTFTPHLDNGDFVVIINAAKVKVTGNKMQQKIYYRHSGHPGGLKETPLLRMLDTYPERVVQQAVKGTPGKITIGKIKGGSAFEEGWIAQSCCSHKMNQREIVENPKPTPDGSPACAEDIPGKTKAWSQIHLGGFEEVSDGDLTIIGAFQHRRLSIHLRRGGCKFIAEAEVQGQIG